MTVPSSYARHEHHEFEAAADEALHNANLQLALGRLGDTLGQRNRDAPSATMAVRAHDQCGE